MCLPAFRFSSVRTSLRLSAHPDKPRLHQTLLLLIALLAMFGWETIRSVAASDSAQSVPSSEVQAACFEPDDGSPDQSLFRKPVILLRSTPSDTTVEAQLPPKDEEPGHEESGCGRGLLASGSNAECRAPPSAG